MLLIREPAGSGSEGAEIEFLQGRYLLPYNAITYRIEKKARNAYEGIRKNEALQGSLQSRRARFVLRDW